MALPAAEGKEDCELFDVTHVIGETDGATVDEHSKTRLVNLRIAKAPEQGSNGGRRVARTGRRRSDTWRPLDRAEK